MSGSSQCIFRLMCLSGLAFCLVGQCLLAGCSKGLLGKRSDIERAWICDETADEAMQRQDYDAGICLHQRFLENNPDNALALYHLGYAYGQTGDHLREVSCYEKAVAFGYRKERVFFNLGMAYGELSEWEKSIGAFKNAVGIDPDSADDHFGLAMAYQGSSADDLAEKEFLKTLEIDPGHLDALLHLSMLCTDRGELQRARKLLHRILEIHPSNTRAREFLEGIEKE